MKSVPYQLLEKEEDDVEVSSFDYVELTTIVLKITLWCLLMALFVVLEFGAVFFVISIFYLMFTNFRKSKKRPDELSAYSVFNPNCEAIEGSLNAKQFENEIKYGLGFH